MKKIALCLGLSFALALAIILFQEFRKYGKVPASTRGLEMGISGYYAMYLSDGGEVFEFNSQKEFIARLKSASTAEANYFWMPPEFVNKDGLVIDTWGRPLQITSKGGAQIEIRSAANDGKFYTFDDIVEGYPKEISN